MLIMPSDLVLSSTLIGLNYLCFELIFMVPKVFGPLKFDCTLYSFVKKVEKHKHVSRHLNLNLP